MDTPNLTAEEEALYNMTDEELEAAFREAKSSMGEEPDLPTDEDEYPVDDEEEYEEFDEPVEEDDEYVDENEVTDDLEQPDEEDSIEDETEIEDDTLSEEEEEEADESTEDQPKENISLEDQKFKIKADGTEFEFNLNELMQLAPKAMNYTRKMQELKPWRQTISALQDSGISHDEVNLMIDALKGDKDAIASIIKRTDFDPLELDPEKDIQYTPREHGRSSQELDIQDIEDRISRDPEYNITTHVVNRQWDDKSRAAMFENPGMIEGLHTDIRSGVFDKVSPMAIKLKALDGGRKSDIEYYVEAGADYYRQLDADRARADAQARAEQEAEQARQAARQQEVEAVEQAKARSAKQVATQKAAKNRKAAAPTKRAAGTKNVIDYLDDSDEAYDDWYNRLQATM